MGFSVTHLKLPTYVHGIGGPMAWRSLVHFLVWSGAREFFFSVFFSSPSETLSNHWTGSKSMDDVDVEGRHLASRCSMSRCST